MDLDRLRYYTRWHAFANDRRYRAPADPWATIRVDPTEVRHHNQRLRLDRGIGRVEGGDWDIDGREPVRETPVYRSVRQRYEEGDAWEETPLYRRARERFEADERVRGYESVDEYRRVRLAYLDDLIRSIETEGYRPNAEAKHEPASTENDFESAYIHRLEPVVAIGRDGEIQLCEGFHRTAIASVAGLEGIPVNVLCRHEEWQHTRDDIERGASQKPTVDWPTGPGRHPDLVGATAPARR
ncbi:hypothetical protein DVK05_01590 [Halorubrum sp. Atlit-8R]|uniref:hypothetical protein n=1 Tax=unclassified Halorubrum TaxID=2642239 RepID=UPI000EF1A955|nr:MULTISPECIES: hypothetical protein [unclassified Halorubrum]RLM71345.1 hypothetical protein DVK08_04170 [Halorubrum sp. Atlit-9R]RLM82502.1 hypothetical protein DVK05_01590 [Halorubrum sp. Atlit-8R]